MSHIVKTTPRENRPRTRDVKPEKRQMCFSKNLQMASSPFASCGFSPMASFLDREGEISIQYGAKNGVERRHRDGALRRIGNDEYGKNHKKYPAT